MPSSGREISPSSPLPPEITVVAIGASAGGLEALSALLSALPIDIAMAFMLIQHLDPRRHSILPELLSKATKIPVFEAIDSMKIESNRVYVMPSNVDISITDGHFGLRPREANSKQHFLPIDIFMRSLAKVRKSQAIGVVLSGTASDGTAGVAAIHAEGGVTFAQDPESAKFDGMPRSAIDSGCIDFVLPPEKIAGELAWMSKNPNLRRKQTPLPPVAPKDEDVFQSILNLVIASSGTDFRKYKPSTIQRRTEQRIASLGISSLPAYLAYLGEYPEEVENLSRHVLIPVTEFFRNPEVFEELVKSVFPTIVSEKAKGTLRVWVVACSTGEEVYSLAISLLEFLDVRANSMRIQIFGTDISEKGIAKARAGIYPDSAMKNVSEERVTKYFTKVPDGYQVNKAVRVLCVFARQDVIKDPPFSNLDLITCRNFLIYLQPELQEKIMSTLHYALNPSGFLLLGSAESAATYPQLFVPLGKKSKIYSKRTIDQRLQPHFKTRRSFPIAGAPLETKLAAPRPTHSEAEIQQVADRLVLKEYAPAGVVINNALEIIHFRGRSSRYLEPTAGRANLNLLTMVREELAIPLRGAIAAARKKAATVHKKNVAFEYGGKRCIVNLSVIPLGESSLSAECFLILFQEVTVPAALESKESKRASLKAGGPGRSRLLAQQTELRAARTLLRDNLAAQESLREDFQTANEELLSANEELQSTNEELETSKEELESSNEELTTVNDELNSNNATLHLLGNDLKNLLESTVIPVVMVDSGLCIRRVTPSAKKIFRVLMSDIGRPITDMRPDFDVDLRPLLITVVRDIVNLDQEVQDRQGYWYRLQLRPYKTLDNRIDGAVLVLVDIDAIKKRNQELVRAGELTKSIIDTMPEPVLVLAPNLCVQLANASFYSTFEVEPEATKNQFVYDLGNGQWNKPDLRVLLEEVLPNHKDFSGHELEYDFPEVGWKCFLLNGRYMVQEPGDAAPLILLSFSDITQRKKTEAALIQGEKLAIASRLAASIAHEINNPLEAITNLLYLAGSDKDTGAAQTYVSQALQELARVSHITQQTLKFHRQSTAQSSVQIGELLDSLLVLYRGKIAGNNIVVHRQYKKDPLIVCLAGDLRQILANLMANASDAMKTTGGSLTLRINTSRDWRNRELRGMRITVADTGVGMSRATQRRIYEPFFTTKIGTGTGLGMWVSAQLVERLQGDMRVYSSQLPGKSGTTFSLFLPLPASE